MTEPIFWADADDPSFVRAIQQARATFRYFWREVHWERHRIVPGLALAAVKAAFWDGGGAQPAQDAPVEEMWMSDLAFDGEVLRGRLLNQPNALTSVAEGDAVELPFDRLSDWLYAMDGLAFGGFTVQAIRAGMEPAERRAHDEAWGFDFGDPAGARIVPDKYRGPNGGIDPDLEHPLSEAMAPSLPDHLRANPEVLRSADEDGLTFLHHAALAGSEASVRGALAHGADPRARTLRGLTARELGARMGWPRVVALLDAAVRSP